MDMVFRGSSHLFLCPLWTRGTHSLAFCSIIFIRRLLLGMKGNCKNNSISAPYGGGESKEGPLVYILWFVTGWDQEWMLGALAESVYSYPTLQMRICSVTIKLIMTWHVMWLSRLSFAWICGIRGVTRILKLNFIPGYSYILKFNVYKILKPDVPI